MKKKVRVGEKISFVHLAIITSLFSVIFLFERSKSCISAGHKISITSVSSRNHWIEESSDSKKPP